MIHYFKRNELNIKKYDNCIESSINSTIYAYSWYLDIVADNWDALVLNDYKAVMPLPWRSKYFIKYVYPPAWTQQLGVFSEKEISKELISEFVMSIPKKFKKVTILFNAGNDLSLFKTQKRINYTLDLNKPYKEIYKNYRSDRKQRITQAQKNNLIIKEYSFSELKNIAKKNYPFIKISEVDYKKLRLLTEYIQENRTGFLLGAYTKENAFLGGSIFLKNTCKIYYLFSVVTSEGKQQQAASLLIDHVLKEHEKSNYIFDFEGSMIAGIASFYKSFGAKEEIYFLYQKPFYLF